MTNSAVLQAVTEQDFLQQVRDLARISGWRVFHCHDSRGSPSGFPDIVAVRQARLIYAELKSERGKLSPDQIEWLDDLRQVPGVEVFVWKPSSWDTIVAALAREAV